MYTCTESYVHMHAYFLTGRDGRGPLIIACECQLYSGDCTSCWSLGAFGFIRILVAFTHIPQFIAFCSGIQSCTCVHVYTCTCVHVCSTHTVCYNVLHSSSWSGPSLTKRAWCSSSVKRRASGAYTITALSLYAHDVLCIVGLHVY